MSATPPEELEHLAKRHGVPWIRPSEHDVDPDLLQLVPRDLARKHRAIPISKAGATLIMAMVDPADLYALDDLKFVTGYDLEPCVTTEAEVEAALARWGAPRPLEGEPERLDDGPLIRLVNLILMDAVKRGASEIHVDPYEGMLSVRYRIDGILHEMMRPPPKLQGALAARIKHISDLDIAERRLPQAGRVRLKLDGRVVSFHVASMPTITGEKFVLRRLEAIEDFVWPLERLGMSAAQREPYRAALDARRGLVLVTGPARVGKQRTLYATLAALRSPSLNAVTAERTTRGALEGVHQAMVQERMGMNLAALLRASDALRPDVVMVDELVDFEVAEIAIRWALRGQLILSTLHVRDCVGALYRLKEMGLEPYLIASALRIIVAQRLGRRLCEACKARVEIPPAALLKAGVEASGLDGLESYGPVGCSACGETGYEGRVAFFEVLEVEGQIRDLFLGGAPEISLRAVAAHLGTRTLRAEALERLGEGITSLEEVLLHTPPPHPRRA